MLFSSFLAVDLLPSLLHAALVRVAALVVTTGSEETVLWHSTAVGSATGLEASRSSSRPGEIRLGFQGL